VTESRERRVQTRPPHSNTRGEDSMIEKTTERGDDRPSESERRELDELVETFRRTSPRANRRDFLRWSAIAGGALATMRLGVGAAAAAPNAGGHAVARYQTDDVQKNVTINVPLDPYGQAVTLDPHRTVNWGPFWVLFPNIWGGLVRFDEMGKVQLDLAESFTVSTDGTVYTYKIRPDAKYASGAKVVADDFVASWKRALDPSHLSPMASFMSQVKNYTRYTTRKSKTIGFRAVDDSTVEITLTKPYSYFTSYLAAFVWSVIDPKVLADKGDDAFFLAPAGTGPWTVTAFDAAKQVVLEPNKNYYDGISPSITKIVWPFVTGPSAASTILTDYKQDKAISADVPLSLKSSVESDPTLKTELVSIKPSGSVRSIAMDFKQPPFNDVRVRRALALAIDRNSWANDIWEGTWTPSGVFTPPVVTQISGYQPPDPLTTDVDGAKKLLEDAGFKGGNGLPPITYYEPSEDTDDEMSRWKSVFDAIESAVGIKITQDTSKALDQIESLQTDNGGRQLDVVWWWNVTETPHLLSEVFSSTSSYMKGVFNWSSTLEKSGDFDPGADSKAFDDLVAKADVEQDQATRNDLYKQAEELVLKNAVYIPLGNWIQMYVQKPYVKGTRQGPWTGRIPVIFDKDVVVVKQPSS
jgi:oligopeptide transport system substrate-binding protein